MTSITSGKPRVNVYQVEGDVGNAGTAGTVGAPDTDGSAGSGGGTGGAPALTIDQDLLDLNLGQLYAQLTGGTGGAGGAGGAGAPGMTHATNGGAGGAGGAGAIVTEALVGLTGSVISMQVNGGAGGAGGVGGMGGPYFPLPSALTGGPTSTAMEGAGGAGGAGGNGGVAQFYLNSGTFTNTDPNTFIDLQAIGGAGGNGGRGGFGAPGTSGTDGTAGPDGSAADAVLSLNLDSFTYANGEIRLTVTGGSTPVGRAGANGNGYLLVTNNTLQGDATDNNMTLTLSATGGYGYHAPGVEPATGNTSITIDGNSFNGGDGNDTLNLHVYMSSSAPDQLLPSLSIDLTAGTLSWGTGVNTIANIENLNVSTEAQDWGLINRVSYYSDISLNGNAADNSLTTGGGNDTLNGQNGDDSLNGGTGSDSMSGGRGNDTYYVDNANDIVVEKFNQGMDVIQSTVSFNLNGIYAETLILEGTDDISATGNTAANALTGNSGANTLDAGSGNDSLDGGTGADVLIGGLGDDTYYVDNAGDLVTEKCNQGNDVLHTTVSFNLTGIYVETLYLEGSGDINATGNSAANTIVGNSGANTIDGGNGNDSLDGGTGADTLTGGAGNDTFYADNSGDVIVEKASQGTDVVRATASFTLGGYVENLILDGSDNIDGTGNTLANVLTGNSGANILDGAYGNDVVDGGAGADTLIGGLGDDTYYVDNAGDVVVEAFNQGTDIIHATVSFNLNGVYAETLILDGTANVDAVGNSAANTLIGNSGNNKIDGGRGNDSLTGGGGADVFFLKASSGIDIITDFATDDRINLHEHALGTTHAEWISQSGSDVVIDMGDGSMVTILNAVASDVLTHVTW